MHLSAMSTSLPMPFREAVETIAQLGFRYVDVPAVVDRAADDREALADTGLQVACVPIGRNFPETSSLPQGVSFDAADVALRRRAVELGKLHIVDAAQLGATHVYVVPPKDLHPDTL